MEEAHKKVAKEVADMSSGCFGCFSGTRKKKKWPMPRVITFAPDELEILHGFYSDLRLYWTANNAAVDGKIEVKEKPLCGTREIFKISRHPMEYAWSFSAVSEEEILFVSYDKDSNEVVFKRDGEEVNRYFIQVVSHSGAVYMKTKEDDKFLVHKRSALKLMEIGPKDQPVPWCMIQNRPREKFKDTTGYIIEMVEPKNHRKWKSADEESQQRVMVQSSPSEQLWRMVLGWAEKEGMVIWSFSAITKNKDLHLTYGQKVEDGLKLDAGVEKMKRSFFAIDAGEGLIQLKRCEEPQHFLCVGAKDSDNELSFCEQVEDAAKWQPRITETMFW